MINIALVTNTISKPGGAENVTISMYDSLRSLTGAHAFILGREEYASINMLIKWVNSDLAHEISKHYVYMRRFPLNTLLDLRKYDLVVNTRSNEVLAPAHIHYLHWIFSPYGIKDSEALTYYRNSYNVYDQSMKYIIRHVLHYMQLKISKLVLANSGYVANLLRELGINAAVLHPPVKSREIMQYTLNSKWENRRKIVVTINRIAPGKQLEYLPLIASKVKDLKFVLVGSIYDKNYYVKLLQFKKVLGAENFIIMPDINRHDLYKLLNDSSIYFHTARHEQFGIAVVEAMAAGVIPVIHRSGGPWYDIFNEKDGIYGLSYSNIEEATEKIKDIASNPYKYAEVSERARFRALAFDEQLFKIKFREIIKNILKL